jgi:hypothetical protein
MQSSFAGQVRHKELPLSVKSTLASLARCSSREEIYPGYEGNFEFCGAHVTWIPDRAGELKACLTDSAVVSTERLPSYSVPGTTTYNVVYRCASGASASIDVEVTRDTAQVSQIGERLQ